MIFIAQNHTESSNYLLFYPKNTLSTNSLLILKLVGTLEADKILNFDLNSFAPILKPAASLCPPPSNILDN